MLGAGFGDNSGNRETVSGVVSYVRRSPRMNPSQRQALERLEERYLIKVPSRDLSTSVALEARVDWDEEFGRTVGPAASELLVELGSGTGDALVASALANPDASLVAFEVYERAVASTLTRLDAAGARNVRVLMVDGVQGLDVLVAPGSVSQLVTFFPDPWPKKRHHKRRLVQAYFASLVASRLRVGGRWLLATDWPSYAEQMREVLDACPGLINEYASSGGWAPRPDSRPITKFEARGLAAGRPVADLAYRRIA